jgi:hypothetical protein
MNKITGKIIKLTKRVMKKSAFSIIHMFQRIDIAYIFYRNQVDFILTINITLTYIKIIFS